MERVILIDLVIYGIVFLLQSEVYFFTSNLVTGLVFVFLAGTYLFITGKLKA